MNTTISVKSSVDSNARGQKSRPPVIILGAARSGTRLLRSLVAATGCYTEVPFDVNYIWRYGNESCPHDAIPLDGLTERTRRFVRDWLPRCAARQVNQPARKATSSPFVEKTVSNILRVPLVKAIYPEAKYVAIVRDGRDVVESAERCWRESPRPGYLLAKMSTFAWRSCAPYAWKFAVGALRHSLRLDKHLRSWGPRYPGVDNDLRTCSLVEVCARQWVACMEHFEKSLVSFAPNELLVLRYENLVNEPGRETNRLCEFLQIGDRRRAQEFAGQKISTDRLGSSRRLERGDTQRVLQIIRPTLERWGYESQLARAA